MAVKFSVSGSVINRRDTSENWTTKNPVLESGEIGYDTDAQKIKIGDGSTAWNDLSYLGEKGYKLRIAATVEGGAKIYIPVTNVQFTDAKGTTLKVPTTTKEE